LYYINGTGDDVDLLHENNIVIATGISNNFDLECGSKMCYILVAKCVITSK